jgi:phosphatidylinositol-3-phosphatase
MIETLRRAGAAVTLLALVVTTAMTAGAASTPAATPGTATVTAGGAVPHYDHIFVIVEENKDFDEIMSGGNAPNIQRLAKAYGSAAQMYGERHPSQPNYVSLVGGDNFGIADDDGWPCVPGNPKKLPYCSSAKKPGYVAHNVDAPNLGTQLRAKKLDWRAYLENLPQPGSLDVVSPPPGFYAAKHTAFTNFKSTTDMSAADRAKHLVGFDALHADLVSGKVPAFALVIPNLCNEMHGMVPGKGVPADCGYESKGLIPRGDAEAGKLVAQIQASPLWKASGNAAIVVTFDENDGTVDKPNTCCVTNADGHNPGGGHIATVVITNHGPRGLSDPTPYDHYSLLRTIEDALGAGGHLLHAGDATVVPMSPLFATAAPKQP